MRLALVLFLCSCIACACLAGCKDDNTTHIAVRPARVVVVSPHQLGNVAEGAGLIPVSIAKSESPDFRCKLGSRCVGVEVTEATDPGDQRELTRIDQQDAVVLRGSLGGRFLMALEVRTGEGMAVRFLKAVGSKVKKLSSWPDPMPEYELLLYTNSNAGSLIFDWSHAFSALGPP